MSTVGVIGLGYVGLPLAVAFAQEGCEVIALDVDPVKVRAVSEGRSYIEDVPSDVLAAVAGRIRASDRLCGPGGGRRCADLRADPADASTGSPTSGRCWNPRGPWPG